MSQLKKLIWGFKIFQKVWFWTRVPIHESQIIPALCTFRSPVNRRLRPMTKYWMKCVWTEIKLQISLTVDDVLPLLLLLAHLVEDLAADVQPPVLGLGLDLEVGVVVEGRRGRSRRRQDGLDALWSERRSVKTKATINLGEEFGRTPRVRQSNVPVLNRNFQCITGWL